jgi:3-keto-disaccharide hydrolase
MRMLVCTMALTVLMLAVGRPAIAEEPAGDKSGWFQLFDGKSLDGWTASENKGSCSVENAMLKIGGGPRSHLFYTGPVLDHNFKNFELKLEVMTRPGANSGVYFHTEYQEEGWPEKGYEAQVNNSHEDWRRTGSLYEVKNVRESPATDNEWFDYDITVRDRRIILKVNGETTVDYTEPDNPPHLAQMPGRKLSSGTIALQAHDPTSVVYYRNIRIKPLP